VGLFSLSLQFRSKDRASSNRRRLLLLLLYIYFEHLPPLYLTGDSAIAARAPTNPAS